MVDMTEIPIMQIRRKEIRMTRAGIEAKTCEVVTIGLQMLKDPKNIYCLNALLRLIMVVIIIDNTPQVIIILEKGISKELLTTNN